MSYTGLSRPTSPDDQVVFTLPQGACRFRSDLNGTQFWSDMQNHYSIPVCESASITGTIPLTVTMESQTGDPCPGMPLYVFDSDSYTRYHGTLEINGVVEFTLLRKRGFTTCKRWPMKLVIDT